MFGRIALVVISSIIGVGLGELVLRWVAPVEPAPTIVYGTFGKQRSIRLREWDPHTDVVIHQDAAFLGRTDGLVMPDEGWRLRTDAQGFILPNGGHEDPAYSVVFLGGSTTECLCMAEENRFPYAAGRLLEQRRGVAVNSYNGGVAGNHTLHSLDVLLNKVVPMRPDAVVMLENINDLITLMRTGSYWNPHPTRSLVVRNRTPADLKPTFAGSTRNLYRLALPQISQRLDMLTSEPPPSHDEWASFQGHEPVLRAEDAPELLRMFGESLTSFVQLCRAWEIEPVLMTQANRFTPQPDAFMLTAAERLGLPYGEFQPLYTAFNQKIRDVGAAMTVRVIDLDREIPSSREWIYDAVHFNDAGSLRAAEVIARALGAEPAR